MIGYGDKPPENRSYSKFYEKISIKRGYKVIWLDEGSDHYNFFVVKPDAYDFLLNKDLNEHITFLEFKF